eukprot:gnl/Spiro4/18599_TR9976_c0_g1_i1.p1 gnl/Spiro4/18599_TR9976_c0_g1~~gnl/Spiro4/18599_TR9976_c0_g1_i1.p1  ORF type:complete len:288 (-),score=44.51 gnl/Spiro4/18599_TR9976_c0_g1_i1:95-958(-)
MSRPHVLVHVLFNVLLVACLVSAVEVGVTTTTQEKGRTGRVIQEMLGVAASIAGSFLKTSPGEKCRLMFSCKACLGARKYMPLLSGQCVWCGGAMSCVHWPTEPCDGPTVGLERCDIDNPRFTRESQCEALSTCEECNSAYWGRGTCAWCPTTGHCTERAVQHCPGDVWIESLDMCMDSRAKKFGYCKWGRSIYSCSECLLAQKTNPILNRDCSWCTSLSKCMSATDPCPGHMFVFNKNFCENDGRTPIHDLLWSPADRLGVLTPVDPPDAHSNELVDRVRTIVPQQ